jgi:uncharacterized protein with von Willebrand factor type A (vWA) domain
VTAFHVACREHHAIDAAADVDRDAAAALWNAVRGDEAGVAVGTFAEAVCDLQPSDYLSLLASSDVAAAWAFERLWRDQGLMRTASPFEHREAARGGWAAFVERAERTEQLAEGFGWDLSSAWEQERELHGSGRISTAEVEQIAKLAGRMHRALRGRKATKVSPTPEEVHSVELGNNIGRLLPAELVHLGEPSEVLLMQRLLDHRALQYAVRGRGEASRGPLSIALDESSSMHDEGDHQRNVWAKAAAIALARTALDDGRPVTVVHYAKSVTVSRLEPGKPHQLVDLARHFLGGGTDICRALHRAAEAVADMARKGDKGADVVIVTDGLDGNLYADGDAAIDAIEAHGSRLWTIGIDCSIDGPLRDRAERYVELGARDLQHEHSVGKLAEAVL